MKKQLFLTILILVVTVPLISQETPPTADEIMSKAIEQASAENKNIFLMFHASWCGWCKRMDAAMKDESTKDYFNDHYVTIHMVVKESANNKHLENPGASEMLAKYKGDRAGIPFWLIFDKNGELIEDSFMKTERNGEMIDSNIGCPAQDNEVDVFVSKINKAARLTDTEKENIIARFRANRN